VPGVASEPLLGVTEQEEGSILVDDLDTNSRRKLRTTNELPRRAGDFTDVRTKSHTVNTIVESVGPFRMSGR